LSERPQRCRTWAPKGQTPVLQYHFNWGILSAMAGVTRWNFYFRLFPGAIRSAQVIEFLTHLLRHVPGKLIIMGGFSPRVRPGIESGRVSIVALEAARVAQLLRPELWTAQPLCPQGPAPDAPTTNSCDCLLAAS
jgi:hypothetical protein